MVESGDDNDMVTNVVEKRVRDEMCKVHCQMYGHQRGGDEDDNNNQLTEHTNNNKFIIESKDQKAKFAFGDTCTYWQYHRKYLNFILAHHPSLSDEVCDNANDTLSSSACLQPIIFWMFYLQALYLKMAYQKNRDFKAEERGNYNHTYNIPVGHVMWLMHYLCLLLYSDTTQFQREFKKFTRRGTDNETLEEFYHRNSFVAHWNRYLIESVTFFGTRMKKNDLFYCGISIQMLFNSMNQRISCPLSTTSSYNVALRFAGNKNGILLLVKRASTVTRYFPLHLFSQYSQEEERFFLWREIEDRRYLLSFHLIHQNTELLSNHPCDSIDGDGAAWTAVCG